MDRKEPFIQTGHEEEVGVMCFSGTVDRKARLRAPEIWV